MTDMDAYQHFIHKSRYARWRDDLGRRESWEETVDRFVNFIHKQTTEKCQYSLSDEDLFEIRNAIYGLEVMPSMRALMTAGLALDRDNVAGYNCSYIPIDHPRAFDEIMYILMCGTGVGFSVENKYISQLPTVAEDFHPSETTIVVSDSKIGWASSFRELISLLYSGKVPRWDVSRVRPAGSLLKTFGGRASGPEPLVSLFEFCVSTFKKAAGRKLTTLEVHDLVCKIAEVVVVGGVRRSALISLSDLGDDRMRMAKSGAWWEDNVQRALANNSAVYEELPDISTFLREWASLYDSKSGERGIFNRIAAKKQAMKTGRRDYNVEFGTNPCSEIILRPYQFCNLTEVILRPEDKESDIARKIRMATIIGTIQSTLTDFRYLRKIWTKNCVEERLLGVSLTGILDNPLMRNNDENLPELLARLRKVAIDTNADWANRLGINPSASITCIKPSGTVSQLVNCSSGIHPSYSRYYLRAVRLDKKDPLASYLKDRGVTHEDDVTNPSVYVFFFPRKAPNGAFCRKDMSAIEQLELYATYQEYWCEHKPSITIYVRENEWISVAAWVYENFDSLGGVSFLPYTDHIYKQAPYQEITEEEYRALEKSFPKLNWNELESYESTDLTNSTQTLACVGGTCEL